MQACSVLLNRVAGIGRLGMDRAAIRAPQASRLFLSRPGERLPAAMRSCRISSSSVWPSAIGNLAYALGTLGGVLAWPRRPWLAAGFYLMAPCAKEAAIVLPALLCLLPPAREGSAGRPAGPGHPVLARLAALRLPLTPLLLVGACFGAFEAVRPHLLLALGDRAPFISAVSGGYHPLGGPLLLRNLVCYRALVFLPWLHQERFLGTWRQWLFVPADAGFIACWLLAGGLRRLGMLWILIASAPAALFAPFDISDLYLYLPAVGLALGAGEMASGLLRLPARRALGSALLVVGLLVAECGTLAGTEAAWLRDGALFARERQARVAVAHVVRIRHGLQTYVQA